MGFAKRRSSHLATDVAFSWGRDKEYTHKIVDHAERYVDGTSSHERAGKFLESGKRGLEKPTLALNRSTCFVTSMSKYFVTATMQPKSHFVGDGDRFQLAISQLLGSESLIRNSLVRVWSGPTKTYRSKRFLKPMQNRGNGL
jgi:hypothetical protein